MKDEKRDFDKVAATWDDRPDRVKLAANIASVIKNTVRLTPDMDVLDFGCGTGLVTMQIQPLVHSITGADSSLGMLEVLRDKIRNQGLANANTEFIDITAGDSLKGNYDVVVSSMTFHHVKKIKLLLKQFYAILKPGGIICLADLDLDDGRFHHDSTGVFHSGFDRDALKKNFMEAGFEDLKVKTAVEVERPDSEGKKRIFSIFSMTGQRPK